jgi:hypothetical protein
VDLLFLLRGLTVMVRLALLAVLITLLVVGRGGRLGLVRRPAWGMITWVHGIFALGGLAVELQHLYWSADPALMVMGYRVYNKLFLVNGLLDAALPAGVLALFLSATRYRLWPIAGLLAVAASGGLGVVLGALREWETLLAVAQLLTFQAIAAYLVFYGLYLMKRLPEVDFYLAAFLVVDALFLLLLPIQEVFFQVVGVLAAAEIWHLHQLLQLTATGVQVAIVLSCVNAMRYRPLAPIFRVRV